MLDIAAALLTITALAAYLNHRFLRVPTGIGVLAVSLILSLVLVGLDALGIGGLRHYEESLIRSVDFSDILMNGMLSMMLFAGALHVNLNDLHAQKWEVGVFAVFGTLLSTALVGCGLWGLIQFFGGNLPLIYCLLFGALISPTDPIAVMGILKSANAPKELETTIAGESLFNDGVGVVMFSMLLSVALKGTVPDAGEVAKLFAVEAIGGIVYGLALGYVSFRMLKSIDNYQVELLITLAAVIGGYSLASHLHVSGPLAMVVAGLWIGNHGRAFAMSDTTREHLDTFWELIDEILNAVLFVLIGLEIMVISFPKHLLPLALGAIAVTLLARLLSIGLPLGALRRHLKLPRGAWKVLTWGGLRGGISVALALSLPSGDHRDTVLALTYCVVVFSILVQGLTVGAAIRKSLSH